MDDPCFDDNRPGSECEADVVKGIDLEREAGLDGDAAAADVAHQHRLEDHHFAVQFPEDGNALGVAFVGALHRADYSTRAG